MRLFSDIKFLKGKFPQLLAVITGTIGAISDGMHYGWTAPIVPLLESQDTPVAIQKSDIVWLENILLLGAFAGLPLTIYIVDRFGRKMTILVAAVESLLAWILISVATRIEVLYVARFLTGIASNVAFVSIPMYIAEIADKKIRGFLGTFIFIMMLIGVLIVYTVAPFVSILTSSMVGAGFLVVQLLTFPFMPESPYYLLMKDKYDKARKTLQILRAKEDVEVELQEMSAAINRQQSEKGRLIDLFLVKSNRKALIIIIVLDVAQQFSCITVMLMNLHIILSDTASTISINSAAITFAAIMLIAAICAACIIDRVGRRILLSSSSILTGICLLILASYFNVKNNGIDISSYTWIPITAVMIYAASFKYGLGLVPIVTMGELFPTSVKAMGMTISDFCISASASASVFLYQYVANEFGMHIPFFIFAVVCLLTAVFTILYIPETAGQTLEEIQLILKGHKLITKVKKPTSNSDGKSNDIVEETV